MAIVPILKTAPSLLPYYEELNLLGRVDFEQMGSAVNDLIIRNWYGEGQIFTKTMQSRFKMKLHGITPGDLFVLDKWYHGRTLLRMNDWYNQYTVLYAPLFRAGGVDGNEPGVQISIPAGAPTFARAHSSTKVAYYVGPDGLHHASSGGIPRYQEGYGGMRGMLLEGDTTNRAYRSFPDSGNLIWVTGVGSPGVSWAASEPSHVYGMTGCTQAQLGASGNTCVWTNSLYGAGTKFSFGVYVKGQGTVRLKLTNVTGGPLYSADMVLSSSVWQLLKYENFAISASPFTAAIESRAAQSWVFIGGLQLEPDSPLTSFILNQSGTGNFSRDMDDLKFPNAIIPAEEGTLFVALKHPPDFPYATGSAYIEIVTGTSSNTFALKFSASGNQWQFHSKTDATKISFVSTRAPGDDVLIACTYHDLQWGHAIYEDGVYKNSVSHSTIWGKGAGLEAGIIANGRGPQTVISAIRLDRKRYNTAEIAAYSGELVDSDQRRWYTAFAGRNFLIEDFSRKCMAGHSDLYECDFQLSELTSSEQATTFDR